MATGADRHDSRDSREGKLCERASRFSDSVKKIRWDPDQIRIMIDIDPALRSTLGFHIGYEKDSMHAKLAGTLRQIGNFGEGMVPEPRPKLANFTYSCQPSIEARCGLQINSGWLHAGCLFHPARYQPVLKATQDRHALGTFRNGYTGHSR